MSEDIIFKEQKKTTVNIKTDDRRMEIIFNKCLILIEDKILQISGKDMSNFHLPIPDRAMDRVSIEKKGKLMTLMNLINLSMKTWKN